MQGTRSVGGRFQKPLEVSGNERYYEAGETEKEEEATSLTSTQLYVNAESEAGVRTPS